MSRFFEWMARTGDQATAAGTRLLQARGVRVAWLVLASAVAVVGLVAGTVQAASVVAHEERTEVHEIDAAGISALHVDNQAGATTVVGVEGADTITVTARIGEGLRATGHRVTEREGTLFVEGSCPIFGSVWCDVAYTVEVPADLSVTLRGHGHHEVSDLTGSLDADVDQGSIELNRVGGDLRLSADQGSIGATDLTADRVTAETDQGGMTLDFADSPRDVAVTADQGSITIVLPDDPDTAYRVQTDVDQGTRNVDSIRTDPDSDRSIVAEADQGSITVVYAPA